MRRLTAILTAGLLAVAFSRHLPGAAADTVANIQKAGVLRCGVSQGYPGLSNSDNQGRWTGIDVDYCRALAAAILGDGRKVKYVPLSAKVRFTALQSGEIDILSRYTSWTFSRDAGLGINFVGVLYHDGQGFMVRKSLMVTSARQLSGASVCTATGTTTELNVADYFRRHRMKLRVVAFEKASEVIAAYDAGRCDVYTTARLLLTAQRSKLKQPDAHLVLPETISKEPVGPAVRQGDDRFFNIAKWVLNALLAAEEYGVTQNNARAMAGSANPGVRRLLGAEGNLGEKLGLHYAWALRAIRTVGNYAEIWRRHLAPLGIVRDRNQLWRNGGLLYSPPFR